MDLASFADATLDAVAGICGDTVVESHDHAQMVLDALLRRPGTERREVAAVFGLSLEQLERCRNGGTTVCKDTTFRDLCRADAVFAWNMIIQRINEAAHWREEFRDMALADGDDGDSDEDGDELCEAMAMDIAAPPQEPLADQGSDPEAEDEPTTLRQRLRAVARPEVDRAALAKPVAASARAKARALFAKQVEAPEVLQRRLVRRLDEEVAEHSPGDREYRHHARSIAASLRRNTRLAAAYAAGHVPPRWLVAAEVSALAPRMVQLQRRVLRVESLKDARMDDEAADLRRKCQLRARGSDLAPPPDWPPDDLEPAPA